MCLIGISNKAIEHFAAKSSNGTASSPVKATLAFDATDINANKRIDKDGRGGYVIVGGEGAGDLVEATGVSDSRELEKVLNSFAEHLNSAITSEHEGRDVYPNNQRRKLLSFFQQKTPALTKSLSDAESTHEDAKQKYYRQNGGQFLVHSQRTWDERRYQMVAAARNAIRACEEAIALLTNGLSLSKTDLVYVFESLKAVVLGLVVASTHY